MSNVGDQIRLYMFLKSLQGEDISNLTIILGTCEQCKHNREVKSNIEAGLRVKDKCNLGHRNKFREPSTFCCMDFIKEDNNG